MNHAPTALATPVLTSTINSVEKSQRVALRLRRGVFHHVPRKQKNAIIIPTPPIWYADHKNKYWNEREWFMYHIAFMLREERDESRPYGSRPKDEPTTAQGIGG